MSHHHSDHEKTKDRKDQAKRPDPERRDPPGNPAGHTAPRTDQRSDPERLERAREEQDRTIAT